MVKLYRYMEQKSSRRNEKHQVDFRIVAEYQDRRCFSSKCNPRSTYCNFLLLHYLALCHR